MVMNNLDILEEAKKYYPEDYYKSVAELIFHLMKYADQDPAQKSRQGKSWIDSIFKQYNIIIDAVSKSGKILQMILLPSMTRKY